MRLRTSGKDKYFLNKTPNGKAYHAALGTRDNLYPSRRGFRRAIDAIQYGKDVYRRHKQAILPTEQAFGTQEG